MQESTSQFALPEQDRDQKRRSSDDSWKPELFDEKITQHILITHILATNVTAGLDRSPAGVYVTVSVDGTVIQTSKQPPLIDAKDAVEWDREIFLPSDRSSAILFNVYASFETNSQTLGNDELLCAYKTTVGELLDRNGQLQLPKDDEDSPSHVLLRVVLERQVDDITRNVSRSLDFVQSTSTSSDAIRGLLQMMSSFVNKPKHSKSGSLTTNTGPRIFALIVAIDKYKSKENSELSGCKRDGERFKTYLTGILGVPLSQIVSLHDEKATRDAILDQFKKHFIENPNIEKGDSMIFFYAGHGSRTDAPEGWPAEDNKIEALCPHDEKTTDPSGKEIYGIPDLTINRLIQSLASKKGDNIVVIFDCCHSGGLNRAADMSSLRVRSTSPSSRPFPLDLDQGLWDDEAETSHRATKTVGLYRAMESHILLAACLPGEVAQGNESGGLFTSGLLKALERSTLQDTTYSRLFERLQVRTNLEYPQHPQCMGWNKDRLLFSVNRVRQGEITFVVYHHNHNLYVSAGRIHGVVEGTEFNVKCGQHTMALKAVRVGPFQTLLEHRHRDHLNFALNGTPESAVVSNWNHPLLKVHSAVHASGTHFTVVPPEERADVAIRQNGSEWVFERFDPLILAYANPCITVDAETRPMLEAPTLIGNFNSYLYRADKAEGDFAKEIRVKLQRVKREGHKTIPTGEDLLDVPSAWCGDMEVKQATVTDLNAEYSLTIENSSEVGLFPYLFYFDPSDYSVQPWYLPPGPSMNPPLQPRKDEQTPGLFAYGYGGFGTEPIEFYLPDGEITDTGFLKIFLTNAYVDMNGVAQSAIDEMRLADPPKPFTKGIWECRTFALTCKAL